MKKTLLRKYAKAIAVVGANVKKGQSVRINANVDIEEFTAMVVDECYRAGAKKVRVDWSSEAVTRLHYRHQNLKTLSTVEPWKEARLQEEVDECSVRIWLDSDDPDGLKGVNIAKMQKASQAVRRVTKKYRDALEGYQQWVIAAAPSKKWAKKVFPNDRTSVSVEKLWRAILDTVYVSEDTDPIEQWQKHNDSFTARCKKLNAFGFTKLEYKGKNGTDFTVGLIPEAEFMGGGETTLHNVYFNPNMPTEEIFTSPMKGVCDGIVYATKPLVYNGNIIDNFSITFKDGKAVSWKAEKGENLLGEIINMDEGAAYLGEVALVPASSPIAKANILFFNTLFDENASCHLALGMGFPNVIRGYENKSLEEIRSMGVNDSVSHVDFMIGYEGLNISGFTKDGKKVELLVDGEWVI